MSASTIEVTDETFEQEVLASDLPVLVDFWAPWCGPCRAISSAIESIARQYAGRLKVVKLNIDQNPRVTRHFDVKSIPSLKVFVNGEVVGQELGAIPRQRIEAMISKFVGNGSSTGEPQSLGEAVVGRRGA